MSKCASVVIALLVLIVQSSTCFGQGFAPNDAVKQMTVADGFEVQVVANEPLVRQPVCIEFDDRGRLWVVQYLQYPNPEGLKRVAVDRYSRTKYDRVPDPPPRGPRGADRITILTDTDGDGRYDQGTDFVDGLNLASGLAFGHGGVFVLNVPYLLFYPDRDRDDKPDSDPEVLLTGFGMEDAHSVANSLMFGPDGWLYGCQGSTVTANIRGIEFQQGVWRYHPVTREFELFCEGGGNSWGLDFDRSGRLFYSTNFGGFLMLHGVQGAYLVKSFAKHGALHNPHSYGYFDHVPHDKFFGGHVTVGGIIYQGDAFPDSFRDKYIAGDLLGHGAYWHHISPRGSTVKSAHGGELIVSKDTWFAPTDVTMGPDGAIYVSDWYDARTAHPDPDADWDRTNGRVFRIAPKGTPRAPAIDFAKLSTDELLKLHSHRSQWYVRKARMELTKRKEGADWLRSKVTDVDELTALEALWTLHAIGGFDEALATKLLHSPHASVRSWTVRFIGDPKQPVSTEMAHHLDEFAEQEPAVEVRQQVAATAARLPANQAVPMVNANINRDIDNDDPYLPLLWWWAIEKHSVTGRDEVIRRFIRPSLWKSRLGRDFLLTRLVRRYAAEANQAGLDSVVKLVKAAPNDEARDQLWPHVLLGLREIPSSENTPAFRELLKNHELAKTVHQRWESKSDDLTLVQLSIALDDRAVLEATFKRAMDPHVDATKRVDLLQVLSQVADAGFVDPLLSIVISDQPESVRIAALKALGRIDDSRVAPAILAIYAATKSDTLKTQIRDVMLGRKASAKSWLLAIDRGEIPTSSTPIDQVQRIALFEDADLDQLVRKHWGQLGMNRGEKLAEVRRLSNDVRASAGNPGAGHLVFKKHCASCHQLFGEGTKLGPDLTSANRKDRDFLLISMVDPSSMIRKEYSSFIVETRDGRVLTGMATTRDDSSVTLVNAKNEKTTIPLSEVETLRESPVSLMPDDLYRQLKPQELRDLFSYLESNGK